MQSLEPDIVFLDIRMPEMDGIEAAQALAGKVHVVFVTAYDQYAVARLRPGRGRLPAEAGRSRSGVALTCQRLRERLQQKPDPMNDAAGAAVAAARRRQRSSRANTCAGSRRAWAPNIRMIPTSDILFFRAEDKYTRVQTRRLRGADPQADQGTDRRARPEGVLADPSRDGRPRAMRWRSVSRNFRRQPGRAR